MVSYTVLQNSSRKAGLGSNTTSPDSGTSLSPAGLDHITRQQRALDTITQDKDEHTYDEVWMHTQQPLPIRAPTGCPAPAGCPIPLPLSNSQYRRSLSLSQQDPVFIPELPMAGSRHVALSQDCSFSEPKRFERALSLPHKIHRPVQLNSSKLTSPEESSDSIESDRQLSAFKKLTPQGTIPPHRHTLIPSASLQHTNLACDRQEVNLNSLSSNQLLTVCSQLSAPNCCVKKLE